MKNFVLAALCLAFPATLFAQSYKIDDGAAGFSASGQGGDGAVILMYHGLDSNFGFNAASFDVQMQYLADNGYHTISLDHLESWVKTGSPALPSKPIVLTFDDNYITVYSVAYPALQSRGFVGTNFTHTNYVGVMTSYDHCDWEEIQEMEDAGVIYTESHTRSHRNLTLLGASEVATELAGSKSDIEANMTSKTCRHLAYPYGGNDASVIAATATAGYDTAVTVLAGVTTRSSNLLELPRYGINPNPITEGTALSAPFLNAVAAAGSGAALWTVSTSEPGYLGSGYHVAPAGDGSAVATWSFSQIPDGNYEVFAHWTANPNRATNAPYTISYAGGSATIRVDQQQNGSTWVSLGVYTFDQYWQPSVTINNDADGYVVADGVQIVRTTNVDAFLIY